MNRELAKSTIDEKMAKVHTCIHALKCASHAIPKDKLQPTAEDMLQVYSLVTVLVDSLGSELELAAEDLADYFQSWGA